MQEGVLYSVYGADTKVTGTTPLDGATVLEAMVKYMAQSGVYVAGQAPFIELHYGAGEVAQSFVRNCCVHGGQIALGVHVSSIILQDGAVSGMKLDGGHTVLCKALAGSYGYVSQLQECTVNKVSESNKCSKHCGEDRSSDASSGGISCVARAIVAVSRPLLQLLTNCKIVIPPGECGNAHKVTVWQCHHTLHTCPEASVLLYLSMNAVDAPAGETKHILENCILALLAAETKTESSGASQGEESTVAKGTADSGDARVCTSPGDEEASAMPSPEAAASKPPTTVQECPEVMFACLFTQELPDTAQLQLPSGVACCSEVGASTEMDSSFLEAEETFTKLFPNVVFLTKAPAVGAETTKECEEQGDDLDTALKALGLV
jgi:GDP dissociation inhibitor